MLLESRIWRAFHAEKCDVDLSSTFLWNYGHIADSNFHVQTPACQLIAARWISHHLQAAAAAAVAAAAAGTVAGGGVGGRWSVGRMCYISRRRRRVLNVSSLPKLYAESRRSFRTIRTPL